LSTNVPANSLQGDLNAAFLFLYYSIFCKSRVIPGLHCKTKWPKSKEFFINHIERANFRGASRRQPNQVGILRIMPSHDSACIEMEDRELKWCDQYHERRSFLEFQPSTLGQGTSMWYPRCSFLINKKVDEFRNWKIKWPKSEEFFIWTPPCTLPEHARCPPIQISLDESLGRTVTLPCEWPGRTVALPCESPGRTVALPCESPGRTVALPCE